MVSEAATGELAATDLATGRRQVLAACDPGLDNFAFDGRGGVFISNFVTGSVVIVDLSSGVQRVVHPAGLLGPCSLSAGPDGAILVGDWMSVAEIGTNGGLRRVAQVPIDFVFSVVGAVDVDGALVVLSSEGQLFWRGSDRSAFVPLDVGGAPVSALCSTRAGALAAAGGRIVRLGPEGATGDPLDAGLNQITAIAAHETAVAACGRRPRSGRGARCRGRAVLDGVRRSPGCRHHRTLGLRGRERRPPDRAGGSRRRRSLGRRHRSCPSARPCRATGSASGRRRSWPRVRTAWWSAVTAMAASGACGPDTRVKAQVRSSRSWARQVDAGLSSQMVCSGGMSPRATARFMTRTTMAA